MKAYKGFNKNTDGTISCNDFVYEIGKTYNHKGKIELCMSGFHACHKLHQAWYFYPNNRSNVFYEVECRGKIIESKDGDGKFVCSEITVLNEVNMSDIAIFDIIFRYYDGFAIVGKKEDKSIYNINHRYNYIDTKGKLLLEKWYKHATSFNYNTAFVTTGQIAYIVDTHGNIKQI